MKIEDYLNKSGYALSFEAIEETRSEKSALRIMLHGSMNETDLLIYPHSTVEVFQIDFLSYAAYSATVEDFTSLDKQEIYKGDNFRTYEKSMYLDFFRNRAGGIEKIQLPKGKEYIHYSFLTFEHVVDVISCDYPKFKKTKPVGQQ